MTMMRACAGMAVAGVFIFSCTARTGKESPVPAALTRADDAGLQVLTGTWVRPDGGYVIEVRSIDPSGRVDAAYYNPRPIHVSRAEASSNAEAPTLYIELRDKGYPGSYYELSYDSEVDLLKGTYFQAAIKQAFEAIFLRSE